MALDDRHLAIHRISLNIRELETLALHQRPVFTTDGLSLDTDRPKYRRHCTWLHAYTHTIYSICDNTLNWAGEVKRRLFSVWSPKKSSTVPSRDKSTDMHDRWPLRPALLRMVAVCALRLDNDGWIAVAWPWRCIISIMAEICQWTDTPETEICTSYLIHVGGLHKHTVNRGWASVGMKQWAAQPITICRFTDGLVSPIHAPSDSFPTNSSFLTKTSKLTRTVLRL